MGKLRPIGSEKLQGIEKLNRIIEISRYKENIPKPVNEDKSREYNIQMPNGVEYVIDREKNGYVIKKRIDESTFEYLEPMKNRNYYRSYSQAFKRLNLIAKEINTLTGNEEGISLFNEQKYVLKSPKSDQSPEPSAAPEPSASPEPSAAPEPSASPEPSAAPEPSASPSPAPSDEMPSDAPSDEMPSDAPSDEMPSDAPSDDETGGNEDISIKSIQKLTGKLAQKMRSIDDEEFTSKDIKYVLNSILSAIDMEKLEDEDKDEILNRLEGEEDVDSEESPEMSGEEPMDGDEEESPSPEAPEEPIETEFKEGMDNFSKKVASAFAGNLKFKEEVSEEEEFYNNIFDGVFSESKVEKVLTKYFNLSEKEKEQINKKRLNESVKKQKINRLNIKEAERLSKTKLQESTAKDILKKYPESVIVGSTNKSNLVIEHKGEQIKITPKGRIL